MLARLDLRAHRGDLRPLLAPAPSDGDGGADGGGDGGGGSGDAGDAVLATVRTIIADVRARGDAALVELTERFDGCRLDGLRVAPEALEGALAAVPDAFAAALVFAHDQIRAYHETQRPDPPATGRPYERNGVRVCDEVRPVDRAGLYAPGGRAPLASSVLMTAVPARVAGVEEIALCVPPGRDGEVPAVMLAAAHLAGVTEVYRVGGAQAIAALAYGTATIAPVDVIVGPGNRYVALAKREVAGTVGIESTAGPSELVVIADGSVPADWVAVDLMAQAEHGPDGAAVLVTWDEAVADAVEAAVAARTATSARRAEIEATMASGGRAVLVRDAAQALEVSNVVAPEHLQLMCEAPLDLVPLVRNAGAVFCGPYAPAPVGDYVAGVNHVLPTARTARFASALRVSDFQKHIHVVSLGADALSGLAPHVRAFAAVEGLEAHGLSVEVRA
jgi:histidinol dehydrogenase